VKIVSYKTHNQEIEIIEVYGDLAGRGATALEEFLYTSLNKGAYYKIIDLKHVRKFDGSGLKVLEYFANRGMQIGLFNLGADIRRMISMLGKEGVFKIYHNADCDKAVSLFKKEILKERGITGDGIMGRRRPRINTAFKTEFKYLLGHNREITGKADVLNLSEGGIFASQIKAFSTKTRKIVNEPDIAGRDLYDLKFELNGTSRLIETRGKCVWKSERYEKLCAGIRFKYMKQNCRKMIKDFVAQKFI
jgi:anti-anti-sigma factor